MRYAVPAAALFGLVCLALSPVPVISGLAIAMLSLVLIFGITIARWIDAALLAVLRRHAGGRRGRREIQAGAGIARRSKSAERAA